MLVLTPDYPPARGGIQLLAHRIVRNATRLRSRVVTLTTPGSDLFDRIDASGDVLRIRGLPGPKRLSNLALNARGTVEGLRYRPDVILSAHIVTSPAAAALRELLRVPVIQYFHAKEIGVHQRLARFAAGRADASIAVSRYTRQLILEAGGNSASIHCVHPGVDSPEATGSEGAADRPTVVTIARLGDRYKGHDVLVRAMPLVRARIPDVRWVVIGDGPLRPSLEALAAANGLDGRTVQLIGAVSDPERDEWLRRASVFAMPSRLPAGGFAGEGFGIVFLEANAHGLPVVAGDVGGAMEAVVDGETGLLVDPTDHVAVAAALTRLLGDADLRGRLGRAGAERAREFSWKRAATRIEDLAIQLCSG
jgi:phosphatidylinositol alpha-1,6-mannosyltransferase